MIDVLLRNQTSFPIADDLLVACLQKICHDHQFTRGEVSVAIVDDQLIHQLNRDHLQHDYPTDVLSFVLERQADLLDGEIIVSSDTAVRAAREHDWPAEHELLLYCVHGALHLVGFDDHAESDRERMREQEQHYLEQVGISTPRPPRTAEQKETTT